MDVKREVGDSNGPRRELARDLAGFAIDGGALLIGVAEDTDTGTLTPSPVPLVGQAERIEQVAATRIDPPLFVQVRAIPTASDPARGYLWVDVPPSPLAPHMVEGAYWGRVDKTKGRLTDAQVLRLHAERKSVEASMSATLDLEIERDPVPLGLQREGHLYLAANPLSPQADLGLAFLKQRDQARLFRLINAPSTTLSNRARGIPPTPEYAGAMRLRAEGIAMSSLSEGARESPVNADRETDLVDIEFREDGGIRAVVGRATTTWGERRAIVDGLAVAYARLMLGWAREYGSECAFSGVWVFGLAATGLKNLSSSVYDSSSIRRQPPIYDAAQYRAVTRASTLELEDQPWAVADRLVSKLLRSLATEQYFIADLQTPNSAG
ncbi:ATP-binding protein [Angustibacter luteus]|uniref:ATP-binding protein n=1 Tax=Angustibacter luteus TaxID=658456 RepID=A0ABW1JFV0_9ACTN